MYIYRASAWTPTESCGAQKESRYTRARLE